MAVNQRGDNRLYHGALGESQATGDIGMSWKNSTFDTSAFCNEISLTAGRASRIYTWAARHCVCSSTDGLSISPRSTDHFSKMTVNFREEKAAVAHFEVESKLGAGGGEPAADESLAAVTTKADSDAYAGSFIGLTHKEEVKKAERKLLLKQGKSEHVENVRTSSSLYVHYQIWSSFLSPFCCIWLRTWTEEIWETLGFRVCRSKLWMIVMRSTR